MMASLVWLIFESQLVLNVHRQKPSPKSEDHLFDSKYGAEIWKKGVYESEDLLLKKDPTSSNTVP